MLNIIGGTYLEKCIDPKYQDLFGSGMRGAAALCNKGFDISFHSCISENYLQLANYKSKTYGFKSTYQLIGETAEFHYYHPLSSPSRLNVADKIIELPFLENDNFLYYGMIEATTPISGKYVVYDPQNHKSFSETKSSAEHLAVILNRNEAELLSHDYSGNIEKLGQGLLKSENAEVVVIKNGSQGAYVFHEKKVFKIPVFQTTKVWPIGTGDIFSAVFAWKWIIERKSPYDSAYCASNYVAHYCESQQLPLPAIGQFNFEELNSTTPYKAVYLAGPFFTFGERFLINELRNVLVDFGNKVFSPYHDVEILNDKYSDQESKKIAEINLQKIQECDLVLAVFSGSDPGTIFEIGYARALNKKVVILAENVKEEDLVMLVGSDCFLTSDFSTAVYSASW